jgi:hypothetical protein
MISRSEAARGHWLAQERSMGALFLTFAGMTAMLALIAAIVGLIGGRIVAGLLLGLVGAGFAAALAVPGSWLWRRSRKPEAKPLGWRLYLWAIYVPLTAIYGIEFAVELGRPGRLRWFHGAVFAFLVALCVIYHRTVVRRQGELARAEER